MSFLGGGDASCGPANPLSQFSKHVQDDKSLQRDRLVGSGPRQQETFRTQQQNASPDMMNEFMQQGGPAPQEVHPLQMEQLRREFEQLQASGPQRTGTPQQSNWAAEFDSAPQAFQSQAPRQAFNSQDFQNFVHMRTGSPANASGNMSAFSQLPSARLGGVYGFGNGMGSMGMMNRPFPAAAAQHMQQQEPDVKGKGRMVELDDQDWEKQFAEMDATEQAEREALERETGKSMEEMEKELGEIDRAMTSEADDWRDAAGDEWDNFDMNAHLPRDPEMGNYMFEEENLFKQVGSPFEEGVRIMDSGGNLSLAALAFEAAVQNDPQHVEAWTRLGAAQAQNEKETPAIRALEQAIKLDPGNLDALMGLAVSYTNEGYDSTAYRTLERWLSYRYPEILPPQESASTQAEPWNAAEIGFTDRQVLHERVTNLFIKAAQLSPDAASMDPDVQVGLGVLFYGAEEYDKAVDCFQAALDSSEQGSTNADSANQRPLLWNRLGATLANSGRSEEAINAYENALKLNPSFVRARYNLGVSCINIGCYAEAAQHLLGALAMHKVAEGEAREKAKEIVGDGAKDDADLDRIIRQNQSTNLFDTLRRVFGQMDRRDLADRVGPGMNVDSFRGEFDF